MMILDYVERHLQRELQRIQENHDRYWRNRVQPTTATALAIKEQGLQDAQEPYKQMLVELDLLRDGPGERVSSKVFTFPPTLRDPRIHIHNIISENDLYQALSDLAYKGNHTVEVSVFVRGLK